MSYRLQTMTGDRLDRTTVKAMAALYERDFVPTEIRDANPDFYSRDRFFTRMFDAYAGLPAFETNVIWYRQEDQATDELAGFVTSANLADSQWWESITSSADIDTAEDGRRTLAIFDLLIGSDHRGRRLASLLHAAALANCIAERATLLSSPPQQPAFTMWQQWGYVIVGRVRFSPDEPELDLFVKSLRQPASADG